MSLISTIRFLEGVTTSLPSKNVCGSVSTACKLSERRSARSINWPAVILDASLKGIGAYPGPIPTAFSSVVGEITSNKPVEESVRLEVRSRGAKGGARLACGDQNGAEMAETGVNVSTKEGKVSLPEDIDVSTLPVEGPEDPVATAVPLNACATGDETAKDDEAEGEEPGCNATSTPGKAFPIARATPLRSRQPAARFLECW